MTYDLLTYLFVLTGVTGVGIWLFPGLRLAWKLLVLILFCTTAVEVAGHVSGMPYELINLLYQIYTPLSFGLYILVFHFLFTEKQHRIFALYALVSILLAGIGIPILSTLEDFPSLSIAICSLILILTSLVMFRELMRLPESLAISKNPRFLLSASVLVYWGLFFFRHGLYNSLIREQNGYTIWLDDLHLWLSVLYYIALILCVVISSIQTKADNHG